MATIKYGTVDQQPLYCCTSCYEYCTRPAGDLRVYGNECWCDLCWDDVRRDDFPDQPEWADLKPYTPMEQQTAPDVSALVEALARCRQQASYTIGGIEALQNQLNKIRDIANEALATHHKGGSND